MSCYSLNTAAKPGISFRKAIPQLVFVEVFLFGWFGFLGVFSFFFKMSRAPQATPLERLLQTDVLPWGCRGSADEDSIDSPLVALLL